MESQGRTCRTVFRAFGLISAADFSKMAQSLKSKYWVEPSAIPPVDAIDATIYTLARGGSHGNTAPGGRGKTRLPRAARGTIAAAGHAAICRSAPSEPAVDVLTGEPRLVRADIASGTWNLLGSVAVTMVPGARIAP
jgi:hypothetical protein